MHGLDHILKSLPDFIDEAIVVDNGSTDGSIEIAKKYNAKLLIEETRGYGMALSKGLKNVTGDTVIIMDGDGSYRTDALMGILITMEKNGIDFISGCRFPLNEYHIMPIENIMCNYFISWITRLMFRINVRDMQSGMLVFKNNILEEVKTRNTGMGFSQEIKIRAWRNRKIHCKEIHIPLNRRIGRTKFRKVRDSLSILYDLLKLKFKVDKK